MKGLVSCCIPFEQVCCRLMFARCFIPLGMRLRQLLFWGIRRSPRTVRAVRCAMRRMCKWGELYLNRGAGVKNDVVIGRLLAASALSPTSIRQRRYSSAAN